MNRLQKKCIIATIGLHLLLVVILLVGPGFFISMPMKNEPPDSRPLITIIPNSAIPADKPVDMPSVHSSVQRPAVPSAEPVPTQTPKPSAGCNSSKSPSEPRIRANLDLIVRTDPLTGGKNRLPASKPDNTVDEQKHRANAIITAVSYLKNNFTAGTDVETPDSGSTFNANYVAFVKDRYSSAWNPPGDTASDDANTKVSVTIGSDGSVISSRILNPSGDAKVDASVQRTLDRVNFVAPFPDGAKEKERTFIINFNLKAKRMLG